MAQDWQLETDGNGVAWLCFDRHDATTNTLSAAVLEGLQNVLQHLTSARPRGLVLWSGKDSGFIAGADINEFPQLSTEEGAFTLIRRGQQVLDGLAGLPCPSVAVLNGFALGGGLEMALACSYRLAFRGDEPVFGLPEIQLGVHPGFGGTVRASRLLGVRKAMDLMLTGRSLRPAEALAAGLVDGLTDTDSWRTAASALLRRRPAPHRAGLLDRLLALPPVRPRLARSLARRARRRAPPDHYPAPYALIDLWRQHGAAPVESSFVAEARSFARLVVTPTSRNLVRVFFLQDRLKKLAGGGLPVQRVHVIGAGIMGGDIAAWCALRGLRVTLQDREMRYIEPALERAAGLFSRKLAGPAAAAAHDRLRADPAGDGIPDADLVLEAVFEDLEVKRAVFQAVEPRLKAGALLGTNTSSIPLETLGATLADPTRLVGLHFFNPVARLPLVEVVQAKATSDEALRRGLAFTRQIGKLPVPCRSHPGFLVNRILAPYMGEAMELIREGVPPVVIDQAATDFGMPMGPVELADSVGLDVAAHVARILAPVLGRAPAPELEQLVARGHLGVKTGQGFYTYRDGRPVRPPGNPDTGQTDVQERLILALLNEAAACLGEGIVADADLIDAGVIFGTGFAPFRGGPLHYARTRGIGEVTARLSALADRHGPRFRPSAGWSLVAEAPGRP